MSFYIVSFTPLEPYFFGNEKTFAFEGEKNQGQKTNSYYIASEDMPMQTTILGALRYIHLPEKTYRSADENSDRIGAHGFRVEQNHGFGDIKFVSPIFMMKDGHKYIVTPFDAVAAETDGAKYKPLGNFKNYTAVVKDADGKFEQVEKAYTAEYDPKKAVGESFVSIETGVIVEKSKVIQRNVFTGNAKGVDKGGFFKKEYCSLGKDWTFAVLARLEGDWPQKPQVVYLGQGRSAFVVEFNKTDETEDDMKKKIAELIDSQSVYVWGDSFVSNEVYNESVFAVTKTREYREYITHIDKSGEEYFGKTEKGAKVYTLIRSGSVFRASGNGAEAKKKITDKFENSISEPSIGFNKIVEGARK